MWWDTRRARTVKLGESTTKHTTVTSLLNGSAGVLLLQVHILGLAYCINSAKISLYRTEKMGPRSRGKCILGLLLLNQKLCSQVTAHRSSPMASGQIKFAQNVFKRYLSYKRLWCGRATAYPPHYWHKYGITSSSLTYRVTCSCLIQKFVPWGSCWSSNLAITFREHHDLEQASSF